MSSTNGTVARTRATGRTGGVAAVVGRIRPSIRPSPVRGYERIRGYGIYGLPFDGGHVLALRVFPENDFAPYRTVWHRTPDGRWSIYVDGPRHDIACPRYYGAAADRVASADVAVTWIGPMALRVEMDRPELRLTVELDAPPSARIANAVGARVPASLWRLPGVASRAARVADRVFGVGDVTFVGTVPNGQHAILLPRRMYPIATGSATLEGEDLGRPVRSATNPTIGNVALPARPMLAVGEAYFEILDPEEYERTRAELATALSG
ncbi:MAG: hypothetical protein ABEJ81_08315 [Haloferacaceae archaeon]